MIAVVTFTEYARDVGAVVIAIVIVGGLYGLAATVFLALSGRLSDRHLDAARGRPHGLKTWDGPVREYRAVGNRSTEREER